MIKKILPDTLAVLLFVAIAMLYFLIPTLEGSILMEHDTIAGVGAGQEAKEYYEEHGERTRWTNALFGGMPTYQISPSYDSTDTLKGVEKVYRLFLPEYVWHIFIMMLGFYILLRAFAVPPSISALGGVLWAFSSYFFILIAAGHLWKFITLAYIPPTLAGIVLAYRKKYLLGAIVAALFASLQIVSNHIQMTYYFLFVILFLVIAYFIQSYQKNELKHFFKATAVLVVAGLVAVAINSSNLYHTYQYSKESIRGKSELSLTQASTDHKGIDREYITQWSYGKWETLTLLVPNFKGGVSKSLVEQNPSIHKADPTYYEVYAQLTQYFGNQPMTAGPVYVGAFVIFLFFVGCFVVKGPIKWALVTGTLFSILLSWGKNFPMLTNFFIDYIPLYNKFRAVSSILVIAEFTIPLLAILGLVALLHKKETITNYAKQLTISLGLSAGVALLIALFCFIAPSLYNSFPEWVGQIFVSTREIDAFAQADQSFLTPFIYNLVVIRAHMVQSDAIRSLLFILAGCGVLYIYFKNKLNYTSTIVILLAICLLDMWGINKRYLNDDLFVPKSNLSRSLKPTEANTYILQDKDPNFRVLNFTMSPFNENMTSYFHKSIGGYNAAKIRRYQELIEHCIYPEMNNLVQTLSKQETYKAEQTAILNMLNTKYYILGTKAKDVLENPHRLGNAWFVYDITLVDTADKELFQLKVSNPKTSAIINKEQFEGSFDIGAGEIKLKTYQPNELTYEVEASRTGLALFSEVYYPGWKAYIITENEKKELPIIRANYILRAIDLPAGKYQLKMEFNPSSLKVTETLAYTGIAVLLLSIIVFGIYRYRQTKQA